MTIELMERIFLFLDIYTRYRWTSKLMKLCKMDSLNKFKYINHHFVTTMEIKIRNKCKAMSLEKRNSFLDHVFVENPENFMFPPVVRMLIIEGLLRMTEDEEERELWLTKYCSENLCNTNLIISKTNTKITKLCLDQCSNKTNTDNNNNNENVTADLVTIENNLEYQEEPLVNVENECNPNEINTKDSNNNENVIDNVVTMENHIENVKHVKTNTTSKSKNHNPDIFIQMEPFKMNKIEYDKEVDDDHLVIITEKDQINELPQMQPEDLSEVETIKIKDEPILNTWDDYNPDDICTRLYELVLNNNNFQFTPDIIFKKEAFELYNNESDGETEESCLVMITDPNEVNMLLKVKKERSKNNSKVLENDCRKRKHQHNERNIKRRKIVNN